MALQCEPPHEIEWKEKERAAEDLLFHIDTISIPDISKLGCYASSFLDFVQQHLLNERALKTVRIGIRLISKYPDLN